MPPANAFFAMSHLEIGTSNVRLNLNAHQQVEKGELESAKLKCQIQNMYSQIHSANPKKTQNLWSHYFDRRVL
jgi:hypothetical protein